MISSFESTAIHRGKINSSFTALLALFFVLFVTGCTSTTDSNTKDDGSGSGSGSSDQEEVVEVTEQEAVETLIQVIRDAGLTFPSLEGNLSKKKTSGFDLSALNYLDLDTSSGGLMVIKLWVGPEGNIIPDPSWQESNSDACLKQGRYMRNATKLLQFKIRPTYKDVQLNYIDVESGKIEFSVEGGSDSEDSAWLADAIKNAWKNLQLEVSVGSAVGPCMDKIALRVIFSSEVTTDLSTDTQPIVYYENVKADYLVTFDETNNKFSGSGDLEWLAYEYNGNGQNLPSGLELDVLTLVTPWIEDGPYAKPTMDLELPGFENGTPLVNVSWPRLHGYVINTSTGNFTYSITGWDVVEDSELLIMQKSFEQNKTVTTDEGSTVKITESTSIKVKYEDTNGAKRSLN